MRYHYKRQAIFLTKYGTTYQCEHPVYDTCTLFQIGDRGLAVIQQRFDPNNKGTYWTEIDPWLNDDIFMNPSFGRYFEERAGVPVEGLYPTVTVRQLMWALKMKPLPKQRWETVFDRRDI